MSSTLDQLVSIFRDVFDDEELIIESSITAGDVDGWDSLAHIRLIVSIEKAFDLHFSATEIANLENVGEMVELITRKQGNV